MSRLRRAVLAGIFGMFCATALHSASAQHTPADVQFMQDMMHHHAQALEMTALVRARSETRAIDLLARRIEITQKDEIAWMRDWLEQRDESVPHIEMHGSHADAPDTVALMPGMLTEEQMSKLAAASGADFDRLFLEFMIQHHEGALTMVKELFSTDGAAQATDVFTFAAEVDADQRSEIGRMQSVLDALKDDGSRR